MSIVYGCMLYTLYHYRIEDDEIVMLLRSNSTRGKRLKLGMEEYTENYWVSDEVPEERLEELFDWMFESAQSLEWEEEIRIIKSN